MITKPNTWTRCYEYRDWRKNYSKHHAYFFSFGALADSLKEYDVIDEADNAIGFVQGEYGTSKAARFVFYSLPYEPFAVAYLDRSWGY